MNPTSAAAEHPFGRGPAGYEVRRCGGCEGAGTALECGGGPHDRPEALPCARCGGAGVARVFVYGKPRRGPA